MEQQPRSARRPMVPLALAVMCGATPPLSGCADPCSGPTCEGTAMEATSTGSGEESSSGGPPRLDVAAGAGGCGSGDGSGRGTNKIDLLFVIDNSRSMTVEQANLARNFPRLVERLADLKDNLGNPISPDVHAMITTTDSGNPLCFEVGPHGYVPAFGAPTTTGCNARSQDFFDDLYLEDYSAACTDVCPSDVTAGAAFVAFSSAGDNVVGATGRDVDGDGTPEPPAAEALACLGPQGVVGCGFESPLESMYLALAEDAPWNSGAEPFLRDDALLAIAILTDEADCSLLDESIMTDPEYTGGGAATSAICWDAGVTCDGPDADGVYTDCRAREDGGLHPLSRYIDELVKEQRGQRCKEVVMLGILGVPEVTARDPDPPYTPIAGGEAALVYRDWREGLVTEGGDLLPEDRAHGIDAAYQQQQFGIGPGCTGQLPDGTYTGQATPNTRVMEVCHALDGTDAAGNLEPRCCIESICSADFSPAIDCLAGLIGTALPSEG